MNFRKYEKKSLKFWWHLGNFSPWGGLKFWGDLEIMGGPRKLDETMTLSGTLSGDPLGGTLSGTLKVGP